MGLETAVDLFELGVVPLEAMQDRTNLLPVFRVLLRQGRGQAAHIAQQAEDSFKLSRKVINPTAEGFNLSIDSLDASVRRLALTAQRFGKTFQCQWRVRGHSCPLTRAS
jgi:hypothetical protein